MEHCGLAKRCQPSLLVVFFESLENTGGIMKRLLRRIFVRKKVSWEVIPEEIVKHYLKAGGIIKAQYEPS